MFSLKKKRKKEKSANISYSRYPPSLNVLKDWRDISNITWFFRGQTSAKICQYEKSRSSLFILSKRDPPPPPLGVFYSLLSTISKLDGDFFSRRFYRLFAPWETIWHYLYPISPLARTKMAGIVWIRSVKDGKSLITQGNMAHLFRYSVKCIDVARTTKKSFVQNDDEHDPHRRQEMKVRFT